MTMIVVSCIDCQDTYPVPAKRVEVYDDDERRAIKAAAVLLGYEWIDWTDNADWEDFDETGIVNIYRPGAMSFDMEFTVPR